VSKRSRVDIYAESLDDLQRRRRIRITRTSYAIGTPVDRAKKSLTDLASYRLARIEDGEETSYSITHRGLEFLDAYWKLDSFLKFLEREKNFP